MCDFHMYLRGNFIKINNFRHFFHYTLCGELFEDNVRVGIHNSEHSHSPCRDYSGTCICSTLVDIKLSSGHPFVLSPVSLFLPFFSETFKKGTKGKFFIILVRLSYKSSLRRSILDIFFTIDS